MGEAVRIASPGLKRSTLMNATSIVFGLLVAVPTILLLRKIGKLKP